MMLQRITAVILSFLILFSVVPSCAMGDESEQNLRTFLSSAGRIGVTPEFAPKECISEWASLSDGADRLHLYRANGSKSRDTYVNVSVSEIGELSDYVYEIDVYPNTLTTHSTFDASLNSVTVLFRTIASDTSVDFLNVYGNRLCFATDTTSVLAVIPEKVWTTISLAVDMVNKQCDVYVNKEKVTKQKIAFNTAIIPQKFRIAINTGYAETDIYFDNIKLYEGTKLREVEKFVSSSENENDISLLLRNSSIFMTERDIIYINGKMSTYSEKAYDYFNVNGVLHISPNAAAEAIGCTVSQLADYVTVYDGVDCIPIVDAARALGKYVYEDERGWVFISPDDFSLSNSIVSQYASEKSDQLDRFMQFERPDGDEIYSALINNGMYRKHPRIFTTASDVAKLKSDMLVNEFKRSGARAVEYMAQQILKTEPVVYEKIDGTRLFLPCLTVRDNLITLTTAYMISDDVEKKSEYFTRIWKELYNCCVEWPDWNVTSHYLDMGKIAVGVALAYDVCYDELGETNRALIRKSLCDKLFYYAQSTYAGNTVQKDITKNTSNWGAVCNGGVLLACLATIDEEVADSEYTLLTKHLAAEALQALEWPISAVYPNGAWEEGLGYFNYVVEYISWSANALQNLCGTDYGILDYPGVCDMPMYAMYIQTAKNGYFNFADGATEKETPAVPPEVFVMAKLNGDSELNDMWYDFKFNILDTSQYTTQAVRDFLFYTPGNVSGQSYLYPLDTKFGSVEIGVMKSGWNADDTYVAAVGGKITSHWDKGGFVFESLGERWAIELGKDDYNLPGGYTGLDGADIYRKRAEGHNTLVFNPDKDAGQIFGETATICGRSYGENEAYTIYDLSNVYADDCNEVKRGFFLKDKRKSLVVQDEFDLCTDNSKVYWFMHTKADIEITDGGKSAELAQNGKKIRVNFLTNLSDWKLEKVAAESLEVVREGQAVNEGITKLRFTGTGSGKGYIIAKFTPVIEGEVFSSISYIPINEWSIDEYKAEISNARLEYDENGGSLKFDARSRSERPFRVIAAAYNDGELLNVDITDFYADNKYRAKTVNNILIPKNSTEIKCMFWDGIKTNVPIDAAQVYSFTKGD